MSEPFWALCFNTNSNSPRAKRWYHIARVIEVDGMLFELYWLPEAKVKRGTNHLEMMAAAASAGIALRPGTWTQYRGQPSVGGSQLVRVS